MRCLVSKNVRANSIDGALWFVQVNEADGFDFNNIALVEAVLTFKEVNELNMLWHPDKFTQYFGDILHPVSP